MAYNRNNDNSYEKYLEDSGFYEEREDEYTEARYAVINDIGPQLQALFPDRDVYLPRGGTNQWIHIFSREYDPDKRDMIYIERDASAIKYVGKNPVLIDFVTKYNASKKLHNIVRLKKVTGISSGVPTVKEMAPNTLGRIGSFLSGIPGSLEKQRNTLIAEGKLPYKVNKPSIHGGRRRKSRRVIRRRRSSNQTRRRS